MQLLKDRILSEGIVLNDSILKVDSFLNHQIDPQLMLAIGQEFARQFKHKNIQRILTIEAAGIAVALSTALVMHVPLVFAKKGVSQLMCETSYQAPVHSFTKNICNNVSVIKKFLPPKENILIIDDFLAHGQAVLGLANIIEQAGSNVSGVGIVIEKSFQNGATLIREKGYDLHSLACIREFQNNTVILD